jgi:hypothetical protein
MKKELNKLIEMYRADEIEIQTVKKYYAFMQVPKTYEVEQIDEVEEVRLQFSKFFKQTTDNSHLQIQSKLDNIYNQEEINKSSRKDLIVSNLLNRKIIMMHEEYGAKNFMNERY